MSEIKDQSLQKIGIGACAVFVSTVIQVALSFIIGVIIVRNTSKSEYGIYSLGLVIVGIFTIISALGLTDGSTRYVAYFRGKNETDKVRGVISSSIIISLVTSILLAFLLFLFSNFISNNIFHSPELSIPLKLFSAAIPFSVLTNLFVSIFLGFDQVGPSIYFQNILKNCTFIFILAIVIMNGSPFIGIIVSYILPIVFTLIAITIYFFKKLGNKWDFRKSINIDSMTKELLMFSFPLVAVNILIMTMYWANTLMIGYFKSPDEVGLYNVATPLASQLTIVLTSLGFLYTPIIANLYSNNRMKELGRIYAVSTKWSFMGSLPLFVALFMFPEVILELLYGHRYVDAAMALKILALGSFVNAITGNKYQTLMAVGKTSSLMRVFLIGGLVNVILNAVLIPPYGIVGAAIANSSGVAISNILLTIILYSTFKIHPITKNYLKSVAIAIGCIILIYIISLNITIYVLTLIEILILFVAAYAMLLIITKSLDEEDISILFTIGKRLGFSQKSLERILKIFYGRDY
jgi:O-antigen/teichoic acid export membrane protein